MEASEVDRRAAEVLYEGVLWRGGALEADDLDVAWGGERIWGAGRVKSADGGEDDGKDDGETLHDVLLRCRADGTWDRCCVVMESLLILAEVDDPPACNCADSNAGASQCNFFAAVDNRTCGPRELQSA
jgi:hypothetical protein